MASCLIHRYRGLAMLGRSYRFNVCYKTQWRQQQRKSEGLPTGSVFTGCIGV